MVLAGNESATAKLMDREMLVLPEPLREPASHQLESPRAPAIKLAAACHVLTHTGKEAARHRRARREGSWEMYWSISFAAGRSGRPVRR
jgi:hypothetical protein